MLDALERKLAHFGHRLGAPSEDAEKNGRLKLVDARLEIGRRLLEVPSAAESVGLDPANSHTACLIRGSIEEDLRPRGVERHIIETCLAALASGVSTDLLYERFLVAFEHAARPEERLEIVDAAIRLVIRCERRLRIAEEHAPTLERNARPLRVRAIAETLIMAIELARVKLASIAHLPAAREAARTLDEDARPLRVLLGQGRIDELCETLPIRVAHLERSIALLEAA